MAMPSCQQRWGGKAHATSLLSETIHQRPMGPFLWRFFDVNDYKIAAGCFWNDVGGREVTLLPSIWLFSELSVGIINMHGNFRPFHLRAQPEPVFVALK